MKLKSPVSKYQRRIWSRRIRNFWLDFSHNKIGMLGLTVLVIFTLTAVLAPWIAPFTPDAVRGDALTYQADNYAVPEWYPIFFPHLSNLPPQKLHDLAWSLENPLPQSVSLDLKSDRFFLTYNASITGDTNPVVVTMFSDIDYPYDPMRTFEIRFSYSAYPNSTVGVYKYIAGKWRKISETGSMLWKIELDIVRPDNVSFPIWDQNWEKEKYINPNAVPTFWSYSSTRNIVLTSSDRTLPQKLGYGSTETTLMTKDIFSKKGEYRFRARISFGVPEGISIQSALGNLTLSNVKLTVRGRIFGLLGTDGFGHDVWSQLLHGASMSLLFGVSSAVIAVTLGILVGVTAGYVGGAVDEVLMRIVDILLCIPVLPILLVLIAMFGYSLWYLVLIIGIFGWQGLSRVIRSHVLSLREMSFVESAQASGASKGYIITKHIVPNILPTALASMVLSVPGAIILEAALSFLGFGDPMAPTWGKMLQQAYNFGAFSPQNLALWDILPPGLAIVLICMGFVFMGHAIDEIINPRLRRRR